MRAVLNKTAVLFSVFINTHFMVLEEVRIHTKDKINLLMIMKSFLLEEPYPVYLAITSAGDNKCK